MAPIIVKFPANEHLGGQPELSAGRRTTYSKVKEETTPWTVIRGAKKKVTFSSSMRLECNSYHLKMRT